MLCSRRCLPLLAIGDYNFDYNFHTKTGNKAFQLFTRDGVWKWLRPEKLIDSNWSDTNPRLPDDQRTDRYPDSILDFIFVAGRRSSGRQSLGWLLGREIFPIRGRRAIIARWLRWLNCRLDTDRLLWRSQHTDMTQFWIMRLDRF